MSYRPYYNPSTFRSPCDDINAIDYFDDLEKPWLHAVGLSAARFYAKQLVSQPFEVSQFLLQVNDFGATRQHQAETFDESDSDEDVDYFTEQTGTKIKALPHKRSSKLSEISSNLQLVPIGTPPENKASIVSPAIFTTLNSIIDKDGPVGLWRGINTGCLYVASTSMIEAWISGFLSSLVGIPDAQFGDIMQSNDPQLFLLIGAIAAGVSHLIMSPLSLIRARMIITTMKGSPTRSLRSSLLQLPACPSYVWLPRICSQVWSKVVELATPLILFQRLAVDEFRSPAYYGVLNMSVELLSLLVKIPLDTFANRAQVSALNLPRDVLILDPVPYKGVFHSILDVLMLRTPISSLYRGWRLELVRLLSKWGYMMLEVTQPAKEKF